MFVLINILLFLFAQEIGCCFHKFVMVLIKRTMSCILINNQPGAWYTIGHPDRNRFFLKLKGKNINAGYRNQYPDDALRWIDYPFT